MLSTSLSSSSLSTPPLHEYAMLKEAFNTHKNNHCKWSYNETRIVSLSILQQKKPLDMPQRQINTDLNTPTSYMSEKEWR
jgi:hypothetical protein